MPIYLKWRNPPAWERKGNYDKAITNFSEVIRLNPKNSLAFRNRATIWFKSKHYEKAISDCNQALKYNKKNDSAYNVRGCAWQQQGEFFKAFDDYTKAIELDSNNPHAARNRSSLYKSLLAKYRSALEQKPNNPEPYRFLAWIYATSWDSQIRNGQKAVELATKACELTNWKNHLCLTSLAAAYAETGDFDAAREYNLRAVKLIKKDYSYLDISMRYALQLTEYDEQKPLRGWEYPKVDYSK